MIESGGQIWKVPGVYADTKITGESEGQLPDFNIGVEIGQAPMGCPYNALDTDGSVMGAENIFNGYNDPNEVLRDYGNGEMLIAFNQARKTTNRRTFLINACKNTQASAGIVDSAAAVSITLKPRKHLWGAPGNKIAHGVAETASTQAAVISGSQTGTATAGGATTLTDTAAGWTISALIGKWVRITGGTGIGQIKKITANSGTALTVATWATNPDNTSTYEIIDAVFAISFTPPKDVALLSANATAGNYFIKLQGIEGLGAGQSYQLSSNAGTTETVVIKSIDRKWTSTGYKVNLVTALANSYTTANYGMIFNKDTSRKVTFTFIGSDYNIDNIVQTINDAFTFLYVEKTGTLPPVAYAETYLDLVSGATLATSPAATVADYTTIANSLPKWSMEFLIDQKVRFRAIDVVTSDSAVHAVYATAGFTLRRNPILNPVQVVTGTAMGDLLTAGSTNQNPRYRAFNLNTDEVQLCAIGGNGLPAYLSTAPQMFGIRMSNPVLHNPTRDNFVFDSVEKKLGFGEYAIIESFITGGVTVPIVTKDGYKVAFSINTYQNQSSEWNKQDKKTYLTSQRDKADFVYAGLIEYLDANGVGIDGPRSALNKAVDSYLTSNYIEAGYVLGYTISPVAVPGGVRENIDIELPDQIDFVALLMGIKVSLA